MSLNQQSKVFHNLPIWCFSAKAWIKRQERTIKPSRFWFTEKGRKPHKEEMVSHIWLVQQRWTHFTVQWYSPSLVKRSIKRDWFCWTILNRQSRTQVCCCYWHGHAVLAFPPHVWATTCVQPQITTACMFNSSPYCPDVGLQGMSTYFPVPLRDKCIKRVKPHDSEITTRELEPLIQFRLQEIPFVTLGKSHLTLDILIPKKRNSTCYTLYTVLKTQIKLPNQSFLLQ